MFLKKLYRQKHINLKTYSHLSQLILNCIMVKNSKLFWKEFIRSILTYDKICYLCTHYRYSSIARIDSIPTFVKKSPVSL